MNLINILIASSAILVLALLWLFFGKQHLKSSFRQTKNNWNNLLQSLQKRQNLLPNLIETIRKHTEKQEELITEMIDLRAKSMRNPQPSTLKIEQEHQLKILIDRAIDLGRIYKELSVDTNFLEVREELTTLESEIRRHLQNYNTSIRNYNTTISRVIWLPIAGMFRFQPANIFNL